MYFPFLEAEKSFSNSSFKFMKHTSWDSAKIGFNNLGLLVLHQLLGSIHFTSNCPPGYERVYLPPCKVQIHHFISKGSGRITQITWIVLYYTSISQITCKHFTPISQITLYVLRGLPGMREKRCVTATPLMGLTLLPLDRSVISCMFIHSFRPLLCVLHEYKVQEVVLSVYHLISAGVIMSK